MQFDRSERKRASNIENPDLDFVDAPVVFDGFTFTNEDSRVDSGEQRIETLGLLAGVPVSIVHTKTDDEIRIICSRKSTKPEASLYFS